MRTVRLTNCHKFCGLPLLMSSPQISSSRFLTLFSLPWMLRIQMDFLTIDRSQMSTCSELSFAVNTLGSCLDLSTWASFCSSVCVRVYVFSPTITQTKPFVTICISLVVNHFDRCYNFPCCFNVISHESEEISQVGFNLLVLSRKEISS